jgi:hypothetical protein
MVTPDFLIVHVSKQVEEGLLILGCDLERAVPAQRWVHLEHHLFKITHIYIPCSIRVIDSPRVLETTEHLLVKFLG